MAESALTTLLFKLASLAHEEFQLLRGITADAENLKAEVEKVMEFLQDAEAHQGNHQLSTVWVSQVRDAAYDSEDALDEFAMLASVRQHLNKISVAHKYIFTPLKLFTANRSVANNMKAVLSKFVSVSRRNERYRLEPRPTLGNQSATSARVNQPYNARFLNESDLVGIQAPLSVLTSSLVSEDNQFMVIPVVGMGGIGKTTLVKNVYDNAAIPSLFQAWAWITFSQAFSEEELLKDLIKQLCNNSAAHLVDLGVETMTGVVALQKKVLEILQGISYLVVLDDVWSVDAWNFIQWVFPKQNCGRVMLTTQVADVAYTSCLSKNHIYEMKRLSDDDSWNLLLKTTSFSESPDRAQLKVAFTDIMEKFEGLPLAIAAFGSVVRAKLMRGDTLSEIASLYSSSTGRAQNYIYDVLLYSYQDLPHHLKCCFLYISIFIEGSHIKKSRLLRLWMAEGFVARNESITMEKVAEEYLTELHDRNLLQVAETRSDGRVKFYRMHSLFREVLMRKATDQNFALVVKGENPCWQEKVRRLSMHNELQSSLPEQNLRKLRTLLLLQVNNHLSSSSFPHLYTRGFKLLTVMDLQGANLDIFPPSIAKLLNLRYLSLRDTNVKEIPRWICKLLKLQTIDCKGTSIDKLPNEILELECLRNLLIYRNDSDELTHSKSGFKAPEEIQCLPSLQKLCFVDAGKSGANIVKKIGSLIQLCRLGIINLSSENGTGLCSSIQMLQNLQSLSLTSAQGEILDLHTLLAPPLHLKRLYLTGKLTYFPEWILLLKKLVKIYLKSSELSQDPLQELEQLPNLVHIELSRSYTGKTMKFASGKFKKLRILGVHNMDSLERLIVGEDAMEDLETFVIGSCRSMKTVPQNIDHLRKPRILKFVNMPSELYESIHPGQEEGPDYSKVEHIPEINFS